MQPAAIVPAPPSVQTGRRMAAPTTPAGHHALDPPAGRHYITTPTTYPGRGAVTGRVSHCAWPGWAPVVFGEPGMRVRPPGAFWARSRSKGVIGATRRAAMVPSRPRVVSDLNRGLSVTHRWLERQQNAGWTKVVGDLCANGSISARASHARAIPDCGSSFVTDGTPRVAGGPMRRAGRARFIRSAPGDAPWPLGDAAVDERGHRHHSSREPASAAPPRILAAHRDRGERGHRVGLAAQLDVRRAGGRAGRDHHLGRGRAGAWLVVYLAAVMLLSAIGSKNSGGQG